MRVEEYPVPGLKLQELLKKSLSKKGVQYDEIQYNGEFVYATYPEKRNYMLTVVIGKKKVSVCWNTDQGWKKGSHLHPGIDPQSVARNHLRNFLRKAFR